LVHFAGELVLRITGLEPIGAAAMATLGKIRWPQMFSRFFATSNHKRRNVSSPPPGAQKGHFWALSFLGPAWRPIAKARIANQNCKIFFCSGGLSPVL
jgi:hypothetical protein